MRFAIASADREKRRFARRNRVKLGVGQFRDQSAFKPLEIALNDAGHTNIRRINAARNRVQLLGGELLDANHLTMLGLLEIAPFVGSCVLERKDRGRGLRAFARSQ
jgi:hypothetical protein